MEKQEIDPKVLSEDESEFNFEQPSESFIDTTEEPTSPHLIQTQPSAFQETSNKKSQSALYVNTSRQDPVPLQQKPIVLPPCTDYSSELAALKQ